MKDITQLDPVALRTLAVAVRLGTFEAAARELHVTPSAVSQRIKALETRIGRVLLHRVKPLEPTEAGLVLVRLATQTELLEREAVAELVEEPDASGTSYASLPIAVNADALYGWFVDALAEVQSRHRVVFEVVREDHTRTAERLWEAYRRERTLRERSDRQRFLAGVMSGFRDRLERDRKRNGAEGLVWKGDGELHGYFRRRHPHVRYTRHAAHTGSEAYSRGRAAGRELVLHRGVGSGPSGGPPRLLPAKR